MQRFLTSLALLVGLGLCAGRAMALGWGHTSGAATLGQVLNFVVALHMDEGERLDTRCVHAEVSSGEHLLPAPLVRTQLETAAGSGERRVRINTTVAIEEPVLAIVLQLGCPPTLTRSFSIFADPAGRSSAAPDSDLADQEAMPDRAASPLVDVLSAAAAGASAAVPRAIERSTNEALAASAAAGSRPRATTRHAAASAATRTRAPRLAVAQRLPRGPRLQLDPVDAAALTQAAPSAASIAAELDAASAAVAAAASAALAEQERLRGMEAALVKLREETARTQSSMAALQLRLKAAEATRYANPLVYLLLGLCAVLTAGVAALWWLRRRERRAAWWAPAASALAPEPVSVLEPPPPEPPAEALPALTAETLAANVARATALAASSQPGDLPGPATEPRRPMSAEELIDLEQQAEFFVVLGQDEAAIDLLMGHVRSTGGVSPLPYLKLLEIYRRRGEREPYDRIRERFNRRFNAYAPEWEVDPEKGLSLEGRPEVMERLQQAWARPSQAMELLDTALFRRDSGPAFDVPAYRELLFLYGVARDLAERDAANDGVDLLLPLNDEVAPTWTSVSASQPAPPTKSLDLDISTDQPPRLSLNDPPFDPSTR